MFKDSHRPTAKSTRSRPLRGEALETRNLMVVGQISQAAIATRGTGFDGVVGIDLNQNSLTTRLDAECSGALLADRRHVLSAAHCFDADQDGKADQAVSVIFDVATADAARFISMPVDAAKITIHPDYRGVAKGSDLAILELPAVAPAGADGYALQRDADEVGQAYTVVGYGSSGTGATGENPQVVGTTDLRRLATNRYESLSDLLATAPLGESPVPPAGSALVSDFDSGAPRHDAFGQLFGLSDLGFGNSEGFAAHGDSGGPVFLGRGNDKRIAGIVSYGVEQIFNPALTTDTSVGSVSFGEFVVDTRVSYFANWIDAQQTGNYAAQIEMKYQPANIFDAVKDQILVTQDASQTLTVSINGLEVFREPRPERITQLHIHGGLAAEDLVIQIVDNELINRISWNLGAGLNNVDIRQTAGFTWTNPAQPLDVNNDGRVSLADVLVLVNELNRRGAGKLPAKSAEDRYFLDPSRDDTLSIRDLLLVVNSVNNGGRPANSASSPAAVSVAVTNSLANGLTNAVEGANSQTRRFQSKSHRAQAF